MARRLTVDRASPTVSFTLNLEVNGTIAVTGTVAVEGTVAVIGETTIDGVVVEAP
jgi:hypothetical protein